MNKTVGLSQFLTSQKQGQPAWNLPLYSPIIWKDCTSSRPRNLELKFLVNVWIRYSIFFFTHVYMEFCRVSFATLFVAIERKILANTAWSPAPSPNNNKRAETFIEDAEVTIKESPTVSIQKLVMSVETIHCDVHESSGTSSLSLREKSQLV